MSASELGSVGSQLKNIEEKSGGEYHFILTNKHIAVMTQDEISRLLEVVLKMGKAESKEKKEILIKSFGEMGTEHPFIPTTTITTTGSSSNDDEW